MADANLDKNLEELPEADAYTQEFIEEEIWSYEDSGPSVWAKIGAEAVGTFVLVLMGVGAAILASSGNNGTLTVGLAFGVSVIIGATIFGNVSGAHFNPAITVGAWIAGRMPGRDVAPYIVAQLVGAAAAGGGIVLALRSLDTFSADDISAILGNASNGFAEHGPMAASGLPFGAGVALVIEAIVTALLVAVALAATSAKAPRGVAPFAIGLTLALLVTWTIPFTNAAINPARAFGSALFADSWALGQLWVFVVAPVVGAAIVGLLFRAFAPEEDLEIIEVLEEIED